MSQPLFDGTTEGATMAERLRFLRSCEDSQTPVVFTDRQQRKHLVYVQKVSVRNAQGRHVEAEEDIQEGQELYIDLSLVDASDGRWPQPNLPFTLAISVATVLA